MVRAFQLEPLQRIGKWMDSFGRDQHKNLKPKTIVKMGNLGGQLPVCPLVFAFERLKNDHAQARVENWTRVFSGPGVHRGVCQFDSTYIPFYTRNSFETQTLCQAEKS